MAAQGHRRDERLPVQDRQVAGEFVWHDHKDTDEAFIVMSSSLRIDCIEWLHWRCDVGGLARGLPPEPTVQVVELAVQTLPMY
jgi:hypothetical protein